MIDFIGVVVGAVVWLGLSCVVGGVFALMAWLLLRKRRWALVGIFAAAILPPACAVYMYVCEVAFPDTSLFEDIDEPLPHGYTLKALGKMPDFGSIERGDSDHPEQPQMEGWIGEVNLNGNVLFGKYSYGNGGWDDKPKWCCFAFDTATGQVKNFATPDDMNAFAGKKITTEEVQFFRSREPTTVRRRRIENWIQLTPPALGALFLVALVSILRLQPKRP